MNIRYLLALLFVGWVLPGAALACADDVGSTSNASQFVVSESSHTPEHEASESIESTHCTTGCCLIGCSCCSIPPFALKVIGQINIQQKERQRLSDLLSAHRILLLRPPIA